MGRVAWFMAAALVAGLPAAAATQSAGGAAPAPPATESLQRSYVFLSNQLAVTVTGDAPGSIQVLRGENGRLDVSGRALGGLPAAALVSDIVPELTLAAAGSARVQYVLVVPADARVSLRLPGRPAAETLGTLDRAATWTWPASPAESQPAGRR